MLRLRKRQAEARSRRARPAPPSAGEELRFSLDAGAAENGRWILRNWQDEIIREENFSGTGFTLPALPNGYYKLEVAGIPGCRSFAVVPDPEKREKNPDLFFAVDSAQSWLAAPQKENRSGRRTLSP